MDKKSTLHYGPPSNDPIGVTVRFMVRLVSVVMVIIRRNITQESSSLLFFAYKKNSGFSLLGQEEKSCFFQPIVAVLLAQKKLDNNFLICETSFRIKKRCSIPKKPVAPGS